MVDKVGISALGSGVRVGKVGRAFGSVGGGAGASGGKVALGAVGIAGRGGTVTFSTDGIASCACNRWRAAAIV
ncbi:hypothetical protein RHMOL_Rhmol10G0253700 [Rhododendron molle]|uniref:Uncharacterized protein n=1 Tax=Rhododendron molle TaxID=49168 RepID=A0ACC0M738_RHOML|nr:hypothetical protein RHMOL_Rhmol10G0253700 [Rhododendron molle]